MTRISRLRFRFGEFWWYSILLFIALRFGDVINAVVGLWLVPKYVPQEELGAVLPLLQVTSVFGLPLTILVITFTKFLNHYHTLGEEGKVKSIIRAFWGWASLAIVLGTGIACLLMPHFFERIRVASGSLGILIVMTAILSTASPMFTNALQALKKFNALTIMNLCTAPLRLVVMLVTMPIRALSGYMLGQVAPPAFQIVWSIFALRREIRPEVRPVPFWRTDGGKIIRYTIFVTLWMGLGTIAGAVQTMVIRQRLPEVESAAYYMISRFAELATYAGLTLAVVMFPLAAEANSKGYENHRILRNLMVATASFGLISTAVLAIFGQWLFSNVTAWKPYEPYVAEMVLLSLTLTISQTTNVFGNYELANNRFVMLWFSIPLVALQTLILVCFTGYTYFEDKLPVAIVDWMGRCNLCSLKNILWTMFAFSVLNLLGALLLIASRREN